MDTVTQALLGAACGQAGFGSRLGKRQAWVWGAIGGLIPDADTVVIPFLGPLAEFEYHRSLTHSLFFAPIAAPILGYVVWRLKHRRREPPPGALGAWILLLFTAIITHPLLDLFTTYGTQLLWPVSHHRFALDAVAIVDPGYSLLLLAALLYGARASLRHGQLAAWIALGASTAFLFYGLWLNQHAQAVARAQLAAEGFVASDVHAYPTLLQPYLRRVVARRPDEIRVGLLSVWRDRPAVWRSFPPPRHPLIDSLRQTPEGQLFEWFAQGQTSGRVQASSDGFVVEIDDLRYGFGDAPDEGLWGIRARHDHTGQQQGPVERFNRRPRDAGALFRRLLEDTFA
jgi:inner membrane protein